MKVDFVRSRNPQFKQLQAHCTVFTPQFPNPQSATPQSAHTLLYYVSPELNYLQERFLQKASLTLQFVNHRHQSELPHWQDTHEFDHTRSQPHVQKEARQTVQLTSNSKRRRSQTKPHLFMPLAWAKCCQAKGNRTIHRESLVSSESLLLLP
ncbi:hypothetical protein H6F50_16675 [Coleofasciculus sp. FACHB-712]|nr:MULTISPECIES: hypothetical protein [unclassified Coleofasciculus]MBD1943976.1 hypothetical protein [Coleofasciculus sp. FACHB-712]MBD2083937.1 hypothetical protein [Coleofasciculus sp. FACHB-542]